MNDQDWVLVCLLFFLGLTLISKFLFFRNFKALFSYEVFMLVQHNQLLFGILYNTIFYGLIAINAAYFFDDYLHWKMIENAFMNNAFIIFLFLLALYFINLGFTALLYFGLEIQNNFLSYSKRWTFVKAWGSWFLLFLSFVLFYTHYFNENKEIRFYLLVGAIFLVLLIFTINQLIRQKSEKNIEWYYYILYLCALEILPIFVAFRFLTN